MKTCTKCSKNKSLDEFYKSKLSKDGLRSECKKCTNIRSAAYLNKNRDKVLAWVRDYNKSDKALLYRKLPKMKFIINLRSRIKKVNKTSSKQLIHDFGCSYKALRNHIEKQFSTEMSWDNYGIVWEIDHIKPICYFTHHAQDRELNLVNHYTNLQPLLKEDNSVKQHSFDKRFWKK